MLVYYIYIYGIYIYVYPMWDIYVYIYIYSYTHIFCFGRIDAPQERVDTGMVNSMHMQPMPALSPAPRGPWGEGRHRETGRHEFGADTTHVDGPSIHPYISNWPNCSEGVRGRRWWTFVPLAPRRPPSSRLPSQGAMLLLLLLLLPPPPLLLLLSPLLLCCCSCSSCCCCCCCCSCSCSC